MDKLLYLLPVLACPIMMGAMMWLMMRGNKAAPATAAAQPDSNTQEEMAILRAEIATLRAGAQEQPRDIRGVTP